MYLWKTWKRKIAESEHNMKNIENHSAFYNTRQVHGFSIEILSSSSISSTNTNLHGNPQSIKQLINNSLLFRSNLRKSISITKNSTNFFKLLNNSILSVYAFYSLFMNLRSESTLVMRINDSTKAAFSRHVGDASDKYAFCSLIRSYPWVLVRNTLHRRYSSTAFNDTRRGEWRGKIGAEVNEMQRMESVKRGGLSK